VSYLVINAREQNLLLYGPSGPVVRKVTRDARQTQAYAKQYAPVDQGPLRASITARVAAQPSQSRVVAMIGSALPYAIYQETGTGIYGPRGAPIRPKRGPYLVFTPKGGNKPVFARQVRGAPATRFLTKALALTAASSGYTLRSGRNRSLI
jgi:hypothetical protein